MAGASETAIGKAGSAGAKPAHGNLILATCILASSLAFIDGSVVNVGLPAISRSLHADAGALQWVVNAYLLPLSALILLGGAAGDRYGRKRLLIWGTALFALASLGCALAPSLGLLLAARFAQGVGSAMLMPNSLAILGSAFEGPAKGRAVGTWAATGAALGAVGPVLGGWLIDIASWRVIFLINLPIAAGAIALAWAYVPRDGSSAEGPLDMLGALTVTLGLGLLAYGLTVGAGRAGWTGKAIATVVASIVLLGVFLLVEKRRGDHAMVEMKLFGSRAFVGLSLLTLLLYGALGAVFVLIPYLLIRNAGYSAASAGAALLPLPVILSVLSPVMGGVAARIGSRIPLTVGPLIVAGGFLLALRIGAQVDYWRELAPALIVVALGLSGAVAPLTTAVLGSVDRAHTGAASGFNSAIARTGGLVGTALLGSVLAASGGALVSGFHTAMTVCAGVCVLASASATVFYRDAKPR